MAKKKAPAGDAAEGGKSKKKLIAIVVVVLVLAGVGYKFTIGKPKPAAPVAVEKVEAPKPGMVLKLDPITMNLADTGQTRYLQVGLALQLSTTAKDLDGAKALDAAIGLLGEQTYAQLSAPGARTAMKNKLSEEVAKLYPDEVLGVYFTQFVMQ